MGTPRSIPPFRIITRLGAGATARTYLAIAESVGAHASPLVCLKVPHPELMRDRAFADAFANEAEIARTLHHPHIVRLQHVGHDARAGLHLAYAYIEGVDLAQLIGAMNAAHAQLAWEIIVLIARQIALALECAHGDQRHGWQIPRSPITHRDLCPPNVLIDLNGQSYVTDFGLAREMQRPILPSSNSHKGRIVYSAPEYLSSREYDERIDLFSCGVVLFESLTGERPFAAAGVGHVAEYLLKVRRRERPTIESLRPEFHPTFGGPPPQGLVRLVGIVDRLLEPNPGDRFDSAADLFDELERITIPAGIHRDLAFVVHTHRPPSRRSIRLCATGEIDPRPLRANASPNDVEHRPHEFDPERDGLCVTPTGAERLISAFADSLGSIDDGLLSPHDMTDPERPAISLAATDPRRPSYDPAQLASGSPHAGEHTASIPTTNVGPTWATQEPASAIPTTNLGPTWEPDPRANTNIPATNIRPTWSEPSDSASQQRTGDRSRLLLYLLIAVLLAIAGVIAFIIVGVVMRV